MATIRRPLVFDKRHAKITATDSDLSREPYEYTYLNQREGIYGIREMTEVEYDNFKAWWRYLYMGDPSVYLTHVASGGNLGSIDDTRYDVGDAGTHVSRFPTAGELDDPALLTQASFANADQTIDLTVTAPTRLPPMLGWAGTSTNGKIEEMSEQQLYANTSFELGKLVTQTGSGMGGYLIHDDPNPVLHADSAETINLGSIFVDTFQTDQTASNPTVSDSVQTGTTYYLHECKSTGRSFTPWTFPRPVYRDGNDIREYAWQDLFDYHQDLMKYIAVYGRPDDNTGAIRYYWSTNASGAGTTTLGTGILNTGRTSKTVITYQYNLNDYRAQEVPSGVPQTLATYSLRGTRST